MKQNFSEMNYGSLIFLFKRKCKTYPFFYSTLPMPWCNLLALLELDLADHLNE